MTIQHLLQKPQQQRRRMQLGDQLEVPGTDA